MTLVTWMATNNTKMLVPLVLLVFLGCATEPVQAPRTPGPEPIEIGSEGSPPILFEKVIWRIPSATRIGAIYDRLTRREIKELIYQQKHIETEEFNILVTDRLDELGYDAVDPTEAVFTESSTVKTRFRVVGVISNAEINTFQHPRRPGNNYQTVAIEMEVRLYDSKTKDVVYEQSFPGSAYDEGSRPTALAPAVLEAVEGALADPDFVSHVTRSRGEPPSLDSVRVAACDVGTVALPEDLQAVSAAVVTVRLGAATGSGVLISGDGHVLTAAHLVDSGAQPRVVLASGLELDAQVERIDRIADLALLVLPGRHHRCARLLDDERQAVGSEVFAVGSPIAERLSGTVTRGVVSGYPTIDGQELIQTDAAVSPGNSGGPIVDRSGRVLGIVTSKALGVGVEGIAFGVPAAVVRERLALDLEEPAPAP